MPSAEYFGGDEHDPEYLDSVTRAHKVLFDELCTREPRLAVILKQCESYDPHALYVHPVHATDDFPHRINIRNLPDFPRNIGITMLLQLSDNRGTSALGKVVTSTHREIEIRPQLLQSAIAAMPEEMTYAVKTDVETRFQQPEEVGPSPSKLELATARIRGSLLMRMCRLDHELHDIIVSQEQYPVEHLIDMAGMPIAGPKNILTGKYSVTCNVETTITTKPEWKTTAEEPFGDVHEVTDQQIFLNDELTEYGLASLSDAQRILLCENVLEEMMTRHAGKFEQLGTSEERAGIRQMFAHALYTLLVIRPHHIKQSLGQDLARYQNFHRN